jgi:alpha-tubulin suppressor-like RCC1 family protein
MAVTGTITTRFIDEKGVDLGRQLVEKDYLISVYPNLLPQFKSAGMFTWGSNAYGQLGDNTTIHRSSPVQTIAGGTNWKQATFGINFCGAIKTDGTLWMWGRNDTYGQLGDNSVSHRSSPVQTVAGGSNWNQVSCGQWHTAAIKTDGTLWTWGRNSYGQLGYTISVHNQSSPVQTISGGTNWKQVSCGGNYTAAVKTDGTLWLWGLNQAGQIGDNSVTNRSSPVQTVTGGTNWSQVSCGFFHTVALKNDGSLWAWGVGNYGNIGDNAAVHRSSPIQTISFGNNWKQIAAGQTYTVAIKTDGTLWSWGNGFYGQIGNNTINNYSSPVQTITAGVNWKQAEADVYTGAIKTDGTLWMWGRNQFGQLGDNSVTGRSSPLQTSVYGTNWKYVSAKSVNTIAIRDANY